ncbi:MAG: beta-N-acetylhexosaminidase [Pseudomonadota bacterium]
MNIGQLLIIGIPDTKPSNLLLGFIRKEKIGGVILFKRNFESVKQLDYLIQKLQEAGEGKLFIGVDQEGGRVMRLSEPFTQFSSMKEIASRHCERSEAIPSRYVLPEQSQRVYDVATALALELSAVGINLNFAPVLDVATNGFNQVIGDRAFSHEPKIVAELGVQFMKGLTENGVMACGKHFPGHGDTDLDSHLALPVMPHTRKRLDACELIPFRQAVAANFPALMTAHILLPNLDPDFPASTSKLITKKILRDEFGFQGLIMSDDLLMKGITSQMSIEDAALKSLQSEHDMVLICDNFEAQCRTVERLKDALDNQELTKVEEKIARINRFASQYCQPPKPLPPLKVIGCKEHQRLAYATSN